MPVSSPDLPHLVDSLARTPRVLRALQEGLDEAYARRDEGPGTYSALDVLGHLIHGEETDWIPRTEHLLAHGDEVPFEPFDREGMRGRLDDLDLEARLVLFEERRAESLARLRALALAPADLARPGRHPELGPVTLGELLSTWAVHDLAHLAQIARVLAKARAPDIGPWKAYFRVLADRA